MKRQPLEVGTTIKLNSINYIVDTVIGDGATCIVYKAHYLDSRGLSHVVNIKECYPYADNVSRYGNVLKWESDEQRQNSISAFVTAYDKLMNRQLGNFTVHAFDIDEANSTQYIIMDANDGVTFDKDLSTSLTEILKTVKLLAHVVGQYHDNGYLHLDIKPSNFLVYPRPSEHIILFDIDSVTAIEDIRNGKISCVPYSKGWAAPEQMQGQINKLCPATDIYSIGAILFEKIMGRNVEPADTGLFADWDFDEKIFENVNPKIKRLLRNIFEKTLAANVKRRYQNVNELITTLEDAAKTAEEKIYLISDYPSPNANFIGRQEELNKIESACKNNIKTVFLHGFGGIGKSELAKKYAQIHKTDYDAIIFLRYENSLSKLIENIEIQNCDLEDEQKNKLLRKLLNSQKVLLIVDNFDVDIDGDEYLEKFLSLRADIIFTTRTDFSVLAEEGISQIEIGTLSENELTVLFEKESGFHFESEEDHHILKKFLKKINYYTLLVPILARQLTASGITLIELYAKLKNGLSNFANTEKIAIDKDNKILKLTALDMMRVTFRIGQLPESYLKVLLNLYFLRYIKINKKQYRKYFSGENTDITRQIDIINDLIQLGWIQKKSDNTVDPELALHSVTVELLEVEFQPNTWHCRELVVYANQLLPWYEFENRIQEIVDDWDTIEQDRLKNKIEWFCAFACSLNLNNPYNAGYVTDMLYRIVNGNLSVWKIIQNCRYINHLINGLEKILTDSDGSKSDIWLFKTANIIETKQASEATFIYASESKNRQKYEKLSSSFYNAKRFAEKISADFHKEAIAMFCKPIIQLFSQYSYEIPDSIYKIIKSYENIFIDFYPDLYRWDYEYDLTDGNTKPFTEITPITSVEQIKDITDEEIQAFNEKTDEAVLEKYYVEKYFLNVDIDAFNQELISDSRLTKDDKNDMYYSIAEKIFQRIMFPFGDVTHLLKSVNIINCDRAKALLQYQEDYYISEEFEDESNAYETNSVCDSFRALIGALQNDKDEFEYYTELLMDNCKRTFEIHKKETLLCYFTMFDDIRMLVPFVGKIVFMFDMLRTIGKCHLAFPYLVSCAELIHNWIKTFDNYSEYKKCLDDDFNGKILAPKAVRYLLEEITNME